MEGKKTISKTELAKHCGVTAPTIYAWMRANRGRIQGYLVGKRVDISILQVEPYKSDTERTAAARTGSAAARAAQEQQPAEIEQLRERIAEQEKTIVKQAAELEHLRDTNRLLQTELETAHRLHAMTLAALPAPRKTLGERIKGLFKKTEPADQ